MDPLTRLVYSTTGGTKKTYLDEVFDTYLYRGDGNAGLTITTGIDLSGEGGMTWIKNRSTSGRQHVINDTVRGAGNNLFTDSNAVNQVDTNKLSSFSSTGFTVGGDSYVNTSGDDYASWNFRKAKGFFDVVTYTGDGASSKTISHSLGSIPGAILIKRTDALGSWVVYHKDLGNDKLLYLDASDAEATNMDQFDKTDPTASSFTVEYTGSGGNDINVNNATYVAYLFAGGESTAATARSVDFDGNDDLTLAASTDLDMGTGDFTVEFWYKGGSYTASSDRQVIIAANKTWGAGFHQIRISDVDSGRRNRIVIWDYDTDSSAPILISNNVYTKGVWRHVAVTRTGGKLYVYVNGTLDKSISYTAAFNLSGGSGTMIGYNPTNTGFVGEISNLRVVKGTAVYTSSFRPPTEPLTNITNTKLLCCNNSSTTGSTVTPGTITASGDPTASTDSPFDDVAGYAFGDSGDQNIIKCGSYRGDGNTEGPIFGLGWEPQWILIKAAGISQGWFLADTMRGIVSDGDCMRLQPDTEGAETEGGNRFDVTSRGIQINSTDNEVNDNNTTYIYIAIRAFDPLVTTPISLGTEAFSMDTGNGSTVIPAFDSGWPVDFPLLRQPASSQNWFATPRIMGKYYVVTDTNDAQNDTSPSFDTDSNLGWAQNAGYGSNYQSWMWRRGPGFDVVCWEGDGTTSKVIPHSLSKIPEMIWTKNRDDSDNWICYHKGLNGGTNPWTKFVKINENSSEATDSGAWNDTAPTATVFTVGNADNMNYNGHSVIAFLFASVTGISKCGYYDGSNSEQTITTGFSPRFLIIKCTTDSEGWVVLDTLRGWGAGDDKALRLDLSSAQGTDPYGAPTATGFTLVGNWNIINQSGKKYIYYAHA